LWERHKTIINSLAEEILGIMEPADKGTWFDAECQAATEDNIKAYRKMQQGHGTRSIIDEYKEKRKEAKRMDECGIRKFGIANAANFTRK